MLAARMHGYKQQLVLEDIKIPAISPDQVLVRVGEAGMCRSDVQLVDGYEGKGAQFGTCAFVNAQKVWIESQL